MKLKDVKASKIFNSRGQEVIEVHVDGSIGSAPYGASTGKKEIAAIPQGVNKAVEVFNKKCVSKLKKLDVKKFSDLKKVEEVLNEQLGFIGGNTVLATEYAILRALSVEKKKPIWKILNPKAKGMPMPLCNVIGGGAHAKKGLDVQEVEILPKTKKFYDAVKIATEMHKQIGKDLMGRDKFFTGGKTDEGAWTTNLSAIEIFDYLKGLVRRYEKKYKIEIKIGIDLAASQLWRKKDSKYFWYNYASKMRKLSVSRDKHIKMVKDVAERFDIWYLEDPVLEDDLDGYKDIQDEFPNKLVVVDDATCTNAKYLKEVIKMNAAKGIIIKPNQVGSLIKTKEAFDLAKKNKMIPVLSHRSGETNDNIIAHLAKAWEAKIVKFGISGGERMSKLNELIRIEG
jgi:enolase